MARTTINWLRAAAVGLLVAHATAQKCYYPNGVEAPDTEKPCSKEEGSACCPNDWQCLDNGLCYYPPTKLHGRYSCTDKDWKSPFCASNMCTYGGTAYGAEDIRQCSNHDNQWCCNADNVNVDCCNESPEPRPFFNLQDGKAYATIGSNQADSAPTIATITGLATGTGSGNNGPSQTSGSRGPSTAGPTSAYTSESISVSSGSDGVKTFTHSTVVTPGPTPGAGAGESNSSSSSSKNNIGLIVGCAVGIPLALALIGIVIWMLRKRRQQKANPYNDQPEMDSDGHSFVGGAAAKLHKKEAYRHSRPGTAEIDGQPVGPGRPISTIKGKAELDSGATFQPGHGAPYGPDTVGLGGGSGADRTTWGSIPPQYSPGANQTAFNHHHNVSELDGNSVMPVINEQPNNATYQAYRPPASGAAELPTVKTPPEDLEKQIQR